MRDDVSADFDNGGASFSPCDESRLFEPLQGGSDGGARGAELAGDLPLGGEIVAGLEFSGLDLICEGFSDSSVERRLIDFVS